MKRNYIVKLLFVVFVAVAGLLSCTSKTGSRESDHSHDIAQQYTCSMHPKIVEDALGRCSICGMELVRISSDMGAAAADRSLAYLMKPVNKQVIATIPVVKAQNVSRIIRMEVVGRNVGRASSRS